MTSPIDHEEELQRKRTKGDSGEGDQDSFGRGKAGAASGFVQLSSNKDKQVKGEHRHLLGNELVEAFVEFFSETLRASANLVVKFTEKSKATINSNSFAIVNWAIETAKAMAQELARTRERGRDATRLSRDAQQQKKPRSNFDLNPGPAGPSK